MTQLTLEEFRDRTVMPAVMVDELATAAPGWIENQITMSEAWIYSRLRKRYAAPFADPVPETFRAWVVVIVTVKAFQRMGVDPRDPQFETIAADRKMAFDEIKEAADSKDGLFDLPVRQDTQSTGISQGAPLAYSEASAYDWLDVQAERLRSGV
jgi:hypothetical protein